MFRTCLGLLALALVAPLASAQPSQVADILDSLPGTVPLADACGVALVPAGRGDGLPGLLFVKGDAGWEDPLTVALNGVRETTDLVLVFRTRPSLDRVRTGDGRVAPDVAGYERRGATFGAVYHDGAALVQGQPVSTDAERTAGAELKAKLAARAVPASRPVEVSGADVNRALMLGGAAVWGAWLAFGRRRGRTAGAPHAHAHGKEHAAHPHHNHKSAHHK